MRCLPKIFLVLFLSYIGFVSAMEPVTVSLRPIDKVFLNACKNNKPIDAILKMEPAPNINAADPEMGYTGLHYVCMNGDVEKAQLLLDNGANINQRSYNGSSPLYALFGVNIFDGKPVNAAQRYEMARFLIEHGADVWLEGAHNQSILQVAAITGDVRSVQLLIDAMNRDRKKDWKIIPNIGYASLEEAIAHNKNDICLLLLDAGVPVKSSQKVKDGVSLMHVAGSRGNRPITQELIKRGLGIDTLDDDGQTALHYASEHGTAQAVQTLLDLGADPRVRDKMGRTPLDLSLTNRNKEVQKVLLQATKSVPKISPQTVGVVVPGATKADMSNKTKSESKVSKRKARKELLASKREVPVKEIPAIKIGVPEEVEASEKEMLSNIDKPEKSIPTSPREMEPTQEETPDKPHKSSKSKFSVKSIGRYVSNEAKNLTEKVEDWTEKVTNPVKEITPATLGKTYAAMVGNQSEERQAQYVTVYDDNMTITVTIPPSMQNRFATMTPQDNPLAKIVSYSPHVEEKRQSATDLYHNFSTHVEESLGIFADSKIIKKATREHGPTIKYTIPARVTIFSEQPIYGTFEFTVRDGQMTHRFFKPGAKKKKKEKISFKLPTSESDKDKGLLQ